MRIIITGGAGFIGRTLAANLAAAGHEVVVLSRNPAQAAGLPAGVRAERWDGRTAAGWGYLADGALAIVNLAGENLAGGGFLPARWTAERKQLIRQSRLDAGHAVVGGGGGRSGQTPGGHPVLRHRLLRNARRQRADRSGRAGR